ncbi:MAG: hypothetical protein QG575_60 [Euryarchaeota archaeon]|nr:hypothetical protein [Euryarchaeota archaeon]
MRMFTKAIKVLLVAALMLSMLPLGGAQIEKRPVEAAAENLFNKGIGSAWVGGEPFASSAAAGSNQVKSMASLYSDCRIIGYLNVVSGLIVASDGGNSLHFTPGPGNYPVYGYFKDDKMIGIFVDFGL